MSSYEKPFLTCSNHAVGVQCVNRGLNNNSALYAQFNLRHSVGVAGLPSSTVSDPFYSPGQHDDVLVSKTIAHFVIDDDAPPTAVGLISGPLLFGSPVRVKEGQWKIYITTPAFFSAVATCASTGTGQARYATCFVAMDTSGPYLIISTWNAAGGILADYDFSLSIFTREVVA